MSTKVKSKPSTRTTPLVKPSTRTRTTPQVKPSTRSKGGPPALRVKPPDKPSIRETVDRANEHLALIAAKLNIAMGDVLKMERNALDFAIVAGRLVVAAKATLAATPHILDNFADWFKKNVKGHSMRSASRYAIVYKQVTADSSVVYKSINDVMKAWRVHHPKRDRFVPPEIEIEIVDDPKCRKEQERRDLLKTAKEFDAPPDGKIRTGKREWLGSPAHKELLAITPQAVASIRRSKILRQFAALLFDAMKSRVKDDELQTYVGEWYNEDGEFVI